MDKNISAQEKYIIEFSNQTGSLGEKFITLFISLVFIMICLLIFLSILSGTSSIFGIIFGLVLLIISIYLFINIIWGIINTRNIYIDFSSINIKYRLPLRKNINLKFEDCIGYFSYNLYTKSIMPIGPTGGTGVGWRGNFMLSEEKGVILKFNNKFILKLKSPISINYNENSLNIKLARLIDLLIEKKIKSFNESINIDYSSWFITKNINKIAEKAFSQNI